MNPNLDLSALPAQVRIYIYYVYAVLGLGLGATQVGYSAAEMGQPTWLTVFLSVYAFLGTALGMTAASNSPGKKARKSAYDPRHDRAPDYEV